MEREKEEKQKIPKEKPVSASSTSDQTYRIFPNDLNSHGTLFGGVVMSLCDRIASVVAERHSQMQCVTLSCDSIHFLRPAGRGEILVFKAAVNRTWTTSMEIGVKVQAENYKKGIERHIVSAYFTFVGLDDDCKPQKVPTVIPESDAEKRRFDAAGERKKLRHRK